MAYNNGFETNTEQLQQVQQLQQLQQVTQLQQLQQVQQVNSVAESPFIGGSSTNVRSKRQCTDSPILFGTPTPSSIATEGLSVCLETKKLIVSTCRAIVLLESNFVKLEEKSRMLQEHSSNGTVPKDVMLPKKKSLFEDEQCKVDDILQTAMKSLLLQRIAETSRKMSENIPHRTALENDFFATLETSRDSQLNRLSPNDSQKIALVHQRYALNVRSFNSQLTTATENAFMKSNREAKKEARKKKDDTPMDTSPEAKVIDVLDRRLKQLGILGKKSRSRSRDRRSGTPNSRSSSGTSRGSSRGSNRSSSRSSESSRSSSRNSSRGSIRKNEKKKKTVRFDLQRRSNSKNDVPTIPMRQRGRGRGRGKR